MNDQRQWISEAGKGVEEERHRLDQDGPSLERYRHPLAESVVSREDGKNVEARPETAANPKT